MRRLALGNGPLQFPRLRAIAALPGRLFLCRVCFVRLGIGRKMTEITPLVCQRPLINCPAWQNQLTDTCVESC